MPEPDSPAVKLTAAQDFSLVLGGPLFQLLRKAHLSDDTLLLVRQRLVVISLVAWLPLLLLSIVEGHLRGGVTLPFLDDIEVHVRFLLVMPLLIAAELVVHRRMRNIVTVFMERNLIPETELPRFNAALASAFRLRNSVVAEVLLLVLVYAVGVLVIWKQYTTVGASSWYATPAADGARLELAGIWYGYVSLPMFQFLLVRWYYRIFIWARFLWQVSRIKLALVPTHPDRVGGLGFLSGTIYAFTLLAAAHGALLSGALASRILFVGATLPAYKFEIGVMVLFLECLVMGPLLVFTGQLAECKRTGMREYGTLAERYVREFDTKWLRGGAPADAALIGSGDIQSLADLGNSYEVVRSMGVMPVTKEAVIRLALVTLLPIVPLGLTMMPLDQLLQTLLKLLF